jgi:hypothetical protein
MSRKNRSRFFRRAEFAYDIYDFSSTVGEYRNSDNVAETWLLDFTGGLALGGVGIAITVSLVASEMTILMAVVTSPGLLATAPVIAAVGVGLILWGIPKLVLDPPDFLNPSDRLSLLDFFWDSGAKPSDQDYHMGASYDFGLTLEPENHNDVPEIDSPPSRPSDLDIAIVEREYERTHEQDFGGLQGSPRFGEYMTDRF